MFVSGALLKWVDVSIVVRQASKIRLQVRRDSGSLPADFVDNLLPDSPQCISQPRLPQPTSAKTSEHITEHSQVIPSHNAQSGVDAGHAVSSRLLTTHGG